MAVYVSSANKIMTEKFKPEKPQESLKSFLEVAALAVVSDDDIDETIDLVVDDELKDLLLADDGEPENE